MVKWTRSTAGSDFSRSRHTRAPACGSPVISSTRRRSCTPEMRAEARLLASVSSFGMPSTDSTTRFSPRWRNVNEIIVGSPTGTVWSGRASPLMVTPTRTRSSVGSLTLIRISTRWSTMEKDGACWISILRSISSSPPTIIAWIGPNWPLSDVFSGMSWIWPSVIITTPAILSRGASDMADCSAMYMSVPSAPGSVSATRSSRFSSSSMARRSWS